MQENDFFTWRRAMLLRFQEMAAAEDVYTELQYQTQRLEFDYYALCVRHPVPFTRPKISLRTTYPPAWVTHYQSENYFAIDPVLKPENFRQGHLHWDDVLFHEAQAMWDAAQRFGLRRGVTQCVMLPNRALGFLSFSRSSLRCSSFTYDEVELRLQLLALLQKIFPIRQCENSVYRNRSRPCLQYQIGRCLGPCVAGLVSEEEYAQQVEYVRLFLSGKDDQVLTQLIARMEKASQDLAFEEAARIRDQIQAVRRVTEKQFVSNAGDDLDVIGVAFDAGMACVHVLFIRQGKVLGSRSYFPKVPGGTELGEVVETFVGQFYLQGSQMRTLPGEILLDFNLSDKTLLADSLSELAGRRIHVQTKPRGDRARYLKLARTNAATALITKLSQQSTITQRLTALAAVLKLPAIKRMECFDISHTMGEQTVASCVVFDANGPLRAEYRRYNIAGITPGDDYAAMNQVLRRRYGKAIEESKIPDVILIDGGKGQLAQAKAVFAELDVPWDKHRPLLLGVAKGADRKAGLEILFFEPEGEGFSLPPDSPALHVIQHIRDESHDHAIGGHRKKRAKVKNTSTLETIEGVGPKRRQMLLKYMGGLQGLRNASVEEIAKVPGISQGLAEKIFWSLKH